VIKHYSDAVSSCTNEQHYHGHGVSTVFVCSLQHSLCSTKKATLAPGSGPSKRPVMNQHAGQAVSYLFVEASCGSLRHSMKHGEGSGLREEGAHAGRGRAWTPSGRSLERGTMNSCSLGPECSLQRSSHMAAYSQEPQTRGARSARPLYIAPVCQEHELVRLHVEARARLVDQVVTIARPPAQWG
jgi:hypothetical protein